MVKLSDMREKEVINVNNGAKIGLVYDFEIDLEKGKVIALVLPGSGKMLSFFGKNNDLIIEWEDIVKIGTDAILVDLNIEE
ncbi:YlmC/YmxH family sporulation protein [Tissierella sp. MSJ-40]|uniref:YlmC/YmxH family sporulation protein n=1 Tax=Tissierella simiarum TaxID=2841534 RepID=A0ABS6E5H2_9FIRM|nr:YlmC/YmxH family sporulation protein [Tissierella simiarum]MBU5438165.1 YlmC/YmxH family sporulation protein [Tissierella simiarum]